MKKRRWMLAAAAAVIACFLMYTGVYYHAEPAALEALSSDGNVTVVETGYGWFFDGPSVDNVLVFYPGAKVEETAYAPLLHRLAEEGMDVCLVKMPLRLAFLGADKAGDIPETNSYTYVYIGGHSLGGAIAADYAAEHAEDLEGVILLAAYPTKELDDDLLLVSIYGSQDGVLNMEKVETGRQYAPDRSVEHVIRGGNHAGFGTYGEQKGDNAALITAEEQQEETVEVILGDLP